MSPSIGTELIGLTVSSSAAMETQSGLFASRPTIFGALRRATSGHTAAILMHPTSNFHGHYLLGPLADRGVTVLAINSRYVNNDSTLIVENVLMDLGAAVKYLRRQGFEKVILLGNSGGGALMATYQSTAEKGELQEADGIGLLAAHPGRARFLTHCLDAAVIDERRPESRSSEWDIFGKENFPPFSGEFVKGIEEHQRARNQRITDYAKRRLQELQSAGGDAIDEAFVIYRTAADPRFVDLSLDANDRAPGTIWGVASLINAAANGTGRFTTCTSFLSQWSLEATRADGPQNLASTSVPVMIMEYTADAAVFPSDTAAWRVSSEGRYLYHAVHGATHYLVGQEDKIEEVADLTAEWIKSI